MDKNAITLGLQIGRILAGQRRKPKTLVGCSYNGIDLPALPDWDKETYPYAVIDSALMGNYRLNLFEHLPYVYMTENGYYCYGAMDGSNYVYKGACKSINGNWDYHAVHTDDSGITTKKVVWTNFDLKYEDGTVCLSASEPVPVYE